MSGALSKAAMVKYPQDIASYEAMEYIEASAAAALADAAATGIPLISESITTAMELDEAPIISGRAAPSKGELIGITCSGDITTAVAYENLDLLFAMALGFEHPDESPATELTYYRHVYEVDPKIELTPWTLDEDRTPGAWDTDDQKVRAFIFAISKDQSDHWINGTMVNSMALNFGITESNIVFNVAGRSTHQGDLTNANWQGIDSMRRAVFPQATVKLSSTDGVAMAETEICVSELTINFNNNLKVDDRSTCSDEYIMEPVRNAFTEITGSVTFPRYTSDDVLEMFEDQESMSLRIEFKNGSYLLGFYLPLIVITEEDHTTSGPEMRQPKFSFTAHRPPALTDDENPFKATTGIWASVLGGITLVKDSPLVVVTKNTNSANMLLTDHA